ncbi:MAG: leucine-rich repeat protein [Flavobacteriales bacterium]|nr:leucine-rich repeat protein [Flavobacteriales bacterium]
MKKHILILSLALLSASCQKSEKSYSSDDIKINPTIATQTKVNSLDDGSQWTANDVIGMKTTSSSTSAQYTYDGSAWNLSSQEHILWENSGTTTFQAWYPASATYTTFTLPYDQSSINGLLSADYMTATTEMAKPSVLGTPVDLNFTRHTAKVVVKIAGVNNQFDPDKLCIDNVVILSRYSKIPKTGIPLLCYMHLNANVLNKGHVGSTYTALVIPSDNVFPTPYDFFLQFVVFNADAPTIYFFPMIKDIPAMEEGKAYVYNVTIGKDVVNINSVIVTDWDDPVAMPDGSTNDISGFVISADAQDSTVSHLKDALVKEYGANYVTAYPSTELKLVGTINQADFRTIASITTLETIDLSECSVVGDITYYVNSLTNEITSKNGNTIPYRIFYNNEKLKYFFFPKDLKYIATYSFFASKLTGLLHLPSTLKEIGACAFQECKSIIGTISIPASVESIGNNAFSDCTGFLGISLSEGLKSIGNYIFLHTNITGSMTVPESVTSMGQGTFSYMKTTSANIKANIEILQSTFENNTLLESVTFSTNYVKDLEYTFALCSALKDVTLPESLKIIGASTFSGCSSLTSLNIPVSVQTIDATAFQNATNLNELVLNWTESIPDGINIPDQFLIGGTGTLSIPAGTTELYNTRFNSAFKLSERQ